MVMLSHTLHDSNRDRLGKDKLADLDLIAQTVSEVK